MSTPTATTHIYTLSLHDALPISTPRGNTCGSWWPGGSIKEKHHARRPSANCGKKRVTGRSDSRSLWSFSPRRASSKRSEEHTSELQSHSDLVCRLLLEKKKRQKT